MHDRVTVCCSDGLLIHCMHCTCTCTFYLVNVCFFIIAGRQHKVTLNDLVVINRIPAELGSQIVLKKVC